MENITWDADDRYIAFYDQDGQIKILCNFNFRVLSFISGPGTKWTGYEILIKTMDGMDFNVKMEVNIEWDILVLVCFWFGLVWFLLKCY